MSKNEGVYPARSPVAPMHEFIPRGGPHGGRAVAGGVLQGQHPLQTRSHQLLYVLLHGWLIHLYQDTDTHEIAI